ncbi:MAG: hypothetical protein JNL98_05680 [Bryobacterales bacterium]|nr:hypothetical protein [Bryobacterales bacterium]
MTAGVLMGNLLLHLQLDLSVGFDTYTAHFDLEIHIERILLYGSGRTCRLG